MKRKFKLRCDERFTHAFTVCGCVSKKLRWLAQTKVISLKTTAVTQHYGRLSSHLYDCTIPVELLHAVFDDFTLFNRV